MRRCSRSKVPLPRLLNPGDVLQGKWKIIQCIGVGAFGEIYSATSLEMGYSVAVKAESLYARHKSLLAEVAALRKVQNIPFVCQYFSCGKTDSINFAVVQLLGISLAEVQKKQADKKLTPVQVYQVMIQGLECIKGMHQKDIIHRDIKPENFVFGPSKGICIKRKGSMIVDEADKKEADTERDAKNAEIDILKVPLSVYKDLKKTKGVNFITESASKPISNANKKDSNIPHIYLIDFGLTRKRPEGFRGTLRYASLNAHQGKELSYRDDLWSLLFVGIELYKGSLPWDEFCSKTLSEKEDKVGKAFRIFLEHLQTLDYPTFPNYDLLTKTFKALIPDDFDSWHFTGYDNDNDLTVPVLCTTERYDNHSEDAKCIIC